MTPVRVLVVALGLGLGGGAVAPSAPAYAAACSGTSGITVVVSSPSGTSVQCAPGDPSSGLEALSGAGFSVTQVQTQPGFVCRINGYPSTDPCVRTPPASASWSYWHARRGGSWSYSTSGAAAYDPAPGTVEGWSFGSGSAPAIAPPAATSTPAPKPSSTTSTPKPSPKPSSTTLTPKPSPKPSSTTSTPKPSPRPSVGTRPKASAPRPSRSAVGSASTTTTPPSTTTTATTGTTTGTGSTTTDEATTALAAGPASPATPAGSPWPLLGGLALVLAVGGGAAYTARRSRAH